MKTATQRQSVSSERLPRRNGRTGNGAVRKIADEVDHKMRFLSDEKRSLVLARRTVCERCDRNEGLAALTVKCNGCRCAGISLSNGSCRLDKWPTTPPRNGDAEPDRPPRSSTAPRPQAPTGKQPIVIRNDQSPGDVVALTAAVRDLHRAHGDRFAIQVQTAADAIWENNPHVRVVRSAGEKYENSRVIKAEYPAVHQSNERPMHFIQAFHEDLERKLGVRIPFTDFKGDIYLSDNEKGWISQVEELGHTGPFWVIIAGGKYDFTAKWWPPEYYQAVVDALKDKVQFVQCGEAGHWHPPLDGVINLVGKADLRQFIRLMYHAQGVVCPVTFAMHAAAAVPTKNGNLRPCVVIAGGREPAHWEQYPGHQFLHTVGALDCCRNGGCWKSRCQKVGDGDAKDHKDLCEQPVEVTADLRVPRCMHMIRPEDVIRAIERYVGESAEGVTVSVSLQKPVRAIVHESEAPIPKAGVVIGHYNRPDALELNIAAIRHHCGPTVPILVSDDCSDGYARGCLWQRLGVPQVSRVGHY